jgi:hypothetical protein
MHSELPQHALPGSMAVEPDARAKAMPDTLRVDRASSVAREMSARHVRRLVEAEPLHGLERRHDTAESGTT